MVILILILFLIFCCTSYLRDVYSYWKKKGVAGPTPWPLVGNYGQVLFRLKTEAQVIQEIYDSYPEAKYVGMYIGTKPTLLLRDVAMIKLVLMSYFKNFPNRNTSIALSLYQKSLFATKYNDHWKYSRKYISFSSNRLNMTRILNNLNKTSNAFLDFTEELVKEQPKLDILKLSRRYFVVLLSEVILGSKQKCFDRETDLEAKIYRIQSLNTSEPSYIFQLVLSQIIIKSIIFSVTKYVCNPFMNIIDSFIKRRMFLKQHYTKNMDTITDIVLETQEKSNLDDETVQLHTAALSIGLTMPTSLISTYFAFELARNPDIQKKCYEEVCKVLKKYNGELNFESLAEMQYLEMVIEEVFRKYGLSFVLDRTCKTKYTFPGTDFVVDPGVHIYIPVDAIRKEPKYFPNPENFIPERFAQENKSKIPDAAHIPFGMGPRICIGKSLSKLFVGIYLASFVQRFEVEPSELTPEEIKPHPAYRVRRPVGNQLWLIVKNRKCTG